LQGEQIKIKLRIIAEELAGLGFRTDFTHSHRGVPYTIVHVKDNRYHITFFGKHQFFRVFKASDSKNPHLDFPLDAEERMFEYFIELRGGADTINTLHEN